MAEGFARRYGSDVLQPASAGLYPAPVVQLLTKRVMEQKNIKLEGQHPKSLDAVDVSSFDLIVNMSGMKLPGKPASEVREWKVQDPIGQSEETYASVRDELEMAVMHLILELRREANRGLPPAAANLPQRATRPLRK
jgi:protein-tyrosine-phosphatase